MRSRTAAATAAAATAALALATVATGPSHAEEPTASDRMTTAVTVEGVTEHLQALQDIADANDGNRGAGTSGYEASAQYVEKTLRDAGIDARVHQHNEIGNGEIDWDDPRTWNLQAAVDAVVELLEEAGLSRQRHQSIHDLSGGERQRVRASGQPDAHLGESGQVSSRKICDRACHNTRAIHRDGSSISSGRGNVSGFVQMGSKRSIPTVPTTSSTKRR